MINKPTLSIGLIGSGFMGKAHVFGLATAQKVFDIPVKVNLHTLADIDQQTAKSAADEFGFKNSTDNWRDLVNNPEIDIIDITAPNALHKEMALEAISASKHVYCEKPLAPLFSDAFEMTNAAEKMGVKTQVGFNYLCNPMITLALWSMPLGWCSRLLPPLPRRIRCMNFWLALGLQAPDLA